MVYEEVIEGLTVRMRSVTEEDAEVTYKMRTDPVKSRFIHPMKGSVENQREYIRKQRTVPNDFLFLIEDLNGKPIGMKGVYNYDSDANTIETGRFIGFGSQVQNIEALKLSFDFAFDVLKVKEIVMSALENNSVMLGIQKKFGAKFVYRDRYDDLEYDSIHSVLTRDAYALSKPKIERLIQRFAGRK